MRTGFRDYLSDIFNMLDMVLVFSLISVSVLRITRVNVSDTQAMATVHVQDLISWLDEGGVDRDRPPRLAPLLHLHGAVRRVRRRGGAHVQLSGVGRSGRADV